MSVFFCPLCDPLDLITCFIHARKMNGRPGAGGYCARRNGLCSLTKTPNF